MDTRKEMKQKAKKVLKRHYWLFVALCLLAAVLGTEFSSSVSVESGREETAEEAGDGEMADTSTGMAISGVNQMSDQFMDILSDIAKGRLTEEWEKARERREQAEESGGAVLGRSRGVLARVVNDVSSGTFVISLTVALRSIVGSESAAAVVLIIGALILFLCVWIFGFNLYQVIMRRMFLEGRCYEKVHFQRALYLLKVRKVIRAGLTMLVVSIYQTLWWFTLVGGVIKRYSYFLVPYIVAENPALNSREAIGLSRRLMKGHKWECFKFELSFLGWTVLGTVTMGLVDIFYANPYRIAAFGEYYAELRELGKKNRIPGSELLNDRYLFEKAETEELRLVYGDVVKELERPAEELEERKEILKFLADVFGLTLWNSKKEQAYEEDQTRRIRAAYGKAALEGRVYPTRLHPIPEKEKRSWVSGIHYIRHYSIWSVIMMFFILAFAGWVWEVSLHLISDGEFVNRGVLHGPWLPIYGTGSVLILLLLNRFRKTPVAEFLLAVVLCGCVEYFTAYYLELTHNGKKWWDYSGYFLNLHGRICAEGLLVFGLGGLMIVYVLAPILDNLIRRIPFKALVAACLVLIGFYTADQLYSRDHPNEGKGITSYTKIEYTPVSEVGGTVLYRERT